MLGWSIITKFPVKFTVTVHWCHSRQKGLSHVKQSYFPAFHTVLYICHKCLMKASEKSMQKCECIGQYIDLGIFY